VWRKENAGKYGEQEKHDPERRALLGAAHNRLKGLAKA
jgi:hypothetical protein